MRDGLVQLTIFIESAVDTMLSADCFTPEARADDRTRESMRDVALALYEAGLLRPVRKPTDSEIGADDV